MDPRTAETVADPRWFPLRYDAERDQIHFAWIPPETHRAVTFIADLRPSEWRSVPQAEVSATRFVEAPLHVILHSGLGGSTLLARALAQPGVVTTFKEPPILTDVVAFGLCNPEAQTRGLLRLVSALLSRPFAQGDKIVCKMSSIGNGLSGPIAELRPDTRILCLQTPLEQMLASLAAKGAEGRDGARRLFIGLQNARMTLVQLNESETRNRSDLELAALAWLSIQRMIRDAADRFGPDRLASLSTDELLDDLGESLGAISRHFGIALDVKARLASGVLSRHAKTGEPYNANKRAETLAATLRLHGSENGRVIEWVREVATANGIAWDLPHPLLMRS
jgi:hypothetical protein